MLISAAGPGSVPVASPTGAAPTDFVPAPQAGDYPIPANPVVAVCGATGAVGRVMLETLERLDFPASRVRALASARSAGTTIPYTGPGAPDSGQLTVEEMTPDSFQGVNIALFSAGAAITKQFAADVNAAGAVIIDNSSAYRMDPEVPLVVPEVNPADAHRHNGIIANPNCSTIQMVVALAPLVKLAPIRRVVVSTYQAASGAGQAAMDELYNQTGDFLAGRSFTPQAFAHQIAFNCIPQIDVFLPDGQTKEEWKMVVETKKILHNPDIQVNATCVRVPVLRSHSESVNVEFDAHAGKYVLSLSDVRAALASAPGVVVIDDPEHLDYPMPAFTAGRDEVFVGRIRTDPTVENGYQMWVVADQLLKGAALNAVQIAQLLLP
ncbi:MAG: aspartate-semialdehyde dehydrogenase [Actinomycetes bacterium]|jgi:aspartate-semialdehyde dehydrogenase|nr:aspartate-semialdehyde dehydrogenase [Actinomycetes bacterium]